MRKFTKNAPLVISMIMVAVIIGGCSSNFKPQQAGEASASSSSPPVNSPSNGLAQSSIGGSVTIDVEWVKTQDDHLEFYVAMNTHSVDLDSYDLGELAILRDNTNNEYRPISWDSAPGGHHRRGTLIFPLPDSVNQGNADYIEIVIRDVAGIEERVLKWEL